VVKVIKNISGTTTVTPHGGKDGGQDGGTISIQQHHLVVKATWCSYGNVTCLNHSIFCNPHLNKLKPTYFLILSHHTHNLL
jgi:hypothetical protein